MHLSLITKITCFQYNHVCLNSMVIKPKETKETKIEILKVADMFLISFCFFRPNSQNLGLAHGQGESLIQQPPQQCGVCEVLPPVPPPVHGVSVLHQCVGHQGLLQTVHQNPQVTPNTQSRGNIV